MTNKLLTSLFEYKAWANQGLFAALMEVPADRRGSEFAIAAFTLDHVTTVDQIFRARLLGEASPFTAVVASRMPRLDELAARAAATDEWYVDYARSASAAELGERIDFTFVDDGRPGRMTREEMLGHVLTHGNSHRGVVGQVLGGLSVAAPADMFTTFLHRDGPG